MPALKQSGNARVVELSSTGIRFSGVIFDDTNFKNHEYDKWKAYGQSKTANALFAVALDKRSKAYGIRAFSVHPGRIMTDLALYLVFRTRLHYSIMMYCQHQLYSHNTSYLDSALPLLLHIKSLTSKIKRTVSRLINKKSTYSSSTEHIAI